MKKYLNTMNICIALAVLVTIYLLVGFCTKKFWPFNEEEYISVAEAREKAAAGKGAAKSLAGNAGKKEYFTF